MSFRRDHRSPEAQAYRPWYKTATWKAIRRDQLNTHPLCAMCEAAGKITAATVCDHVEPHNGNWELFVGGPFQSLCKSHHDGAKQSEERLGYSTRVDAKTGWPIDERHPANGGKRSAAGTSKLGPITHPYWFRPLSLPLIIVCGPPASGKSTYVARNKGPHDVVLDLDTIARGLFGKSIWFLDPESRVQCLKARNETVGDLIRRRPNATADSKAWLIVSEPDALKRQWWSDTLRPEKIIVLETPADACLARAKADLETKRTGRIGEAVAGWWSAYTRRPGDVVVID